MKLFPSRVRPPALLTAVLLAVLIPGCAKTPDTADIAPPRVLDVALTLSAPPNDNFYYYMVIDANGGGDGPMPVVVSDVAGQGWVTGSATHFVEYHQGRFTIYKFLDPDDFQQYSPIGSPARYSAVGRTILFSVDITDLQVTGESVDVNFIALDNPFDEHRTLDALISAGTSALNVNITRDDTINNERLGFIELPNDLLRDGVPTPVSDVTQSLDILDWSIEINI